MSGSIYQLAKVTYLDLISTANRSTSLSRGVVYLRMINKFVEEMKRSTWKLHCQDGTKATTTC